MFVVQDLDTPSNKNVNVREGLLHMELLSQQPRSLYYQDGNHQDLNILQSSVLLGERWLGPKGDLPYLCRSSYKPTAWAIVFNGYRGAGGCLCVSRWSHMSPLLISVICMKSSAQAGRQFRDYSHSWRDPGKPERKFAFTRSPAELVGQRMHGPIPVPLASIHTIQHTIGDQGIVTT